MAECKQCHKKGLLLRVNNQGICLFCEGVNSVYGQQPQLIAQINELQRQLSDETTLYNNFANKAKEEALDEIKPQINLLYQHKSQLLVELEDLRSQIIETNDTILLQSFGLYEPKFKFINSDEYKNRLDNIRQQQKLMIKNDGAVTGNSNWQVNGSNSEGKRMINETKKLILRAFNSECDEIIDNVKYSNLDSSRKRIDKSCDAISKLGKTLGISITYGYRLLKLQEIDLAFEYALKKQEEREAAKEIRAQQREEERVAKEIAEAKKKLDKENSHYHNVLAQLDSQLEKAADGEKEELLKRREEIVNKIEEIKHAQEEVDYREANRKAGYVYVISNIGSFGEDIYKIGMTRRLDPQERISELSDASVPFNFDVHAMIFSDNAPALEAALHRAFEDKKLNLINTRREFFNVTLDEIKAVVNANHDKLAEFVYEPQAEQFRLSEKLKSENRG
ncbi:MAG: DUF4041 domain-containing protein [Oscillospiraceae bacterium]|jgi:rubrerythrin|nr:DUF4041 domain-containing protein [Oscillospiraceae bacterium]